jgi:hypothetical protein
MPCLHDLYQARARRLEARIPGLGTTDIWPYKRYFHWMIDNGAPRSTTYCYPYRSMAVVIVDLLTWTVLQGSEPWLEHLEELGP